MINSDLQAIHRVRDRLIARRTAVINQLRAFLLERGMTFAKTPAKLRIEMPGILENADNGLTPLMRNLIDVLWGEWKTVEQQIKGLSDELQRIADSDAGCIRIQQIPGIGPVVATAIVAAIGNGAAFRKGRDFSTWLGIVPKQHTTGDKARLLGISKRGNTYLRKILIHGERAAVLRIKTRPRAHRCLDGCAGSPSPSQYPHRGDGQQDGANCLGGAVERRRVPPLYR